MIAGGKKLADQAADRLFFRVFHKPRVAAFALDAKTKGGMFPAKRPASTPAFGDAVFYALADEPALELGEK
jgi:hypothetical protein